MPGSCTFEIHREGNAHRQLDEFGGYDAQQDQAAADSQQEADPSPIRRQLGDTALPDFSSGAVRKKNGARQTHCEPADEGKKQHPPTLPYQAYERLS